MRIAVTFILVTMTVDMKPLLDIWQLLPFNRKTQVPSPPSSSFSTIAAAAGFKIRELFAEACSARAARKAIVRLPVETLHRAHLVWLAGKPHVSISFHPRVEFSFS